MEDNITVGRRTGFTLIELLIVLAIVGILAAILVPRLFAARATASDRAAESYAKAVHLAGNAYLAYDLSAQAAEAVEACGAGEEYAPGASGTFVVPDPGEVVADCQVSDLGGTDIQVVVASRTGAVFTFP